MFRRLKEMQSLIDASRKSLKNAESTIEELRDSILQRDKFIEEQQKTIHSWKEENTALHEENKDIRFDNEEFRNLFNKIKTISESNSYSNEKIALSKINELVNDFDSNY